MTEPTRLTEAELERLLALADAVKNHHVPSDGIAAIDDYLAATRPPTLRALVEEVRRLRAALDSIIAELRDEPGDDDRLARTLSLAKAEEARDAS